MRLIATASDLPKLEALINSFFYSTKYKVNESLKIEHPDKVINNYRVVSKGNRFRFEEV